MLLFSCRGLSRAFDRGALFDDLGFELFSGERVGFVGPNGAGKTTLMRILANEDQPDAGEVRLHAGARLMLLQQHAEFPPTRTLFQEARSAFDELLKAQEELVQVAELISTATNDAELKAHTAKFDRLNEILATQDAYTLDHRIDQVLGGLGFGPDDYDRPLRTFSGGQQRRILLAKLLLSAPDVMLLDEPSNHLDIDTVRWLESYLISQPQAMMIVSHDRYFLNRVCTRILELHDRKVTAYPGNFQQYLRLRKERYEQQLKEFEAQKEYIEKQEDYIKRVNYGQLAKQAQSRRKALEKIEVLEKPTMIVAPEMHFGQAVRSGDVVFHAYELSKRYGDHVLFENLSFDIQRGKRVGILGPNGAGKTTLLRIMLGEETPTSGKMQRGQLVFPGYLDQHLKMLPEDKSVIRAIWADPDPELTEQRMRDLLSRFGLSGKIVEQPIKECSGGERSRAALARLVVEGANVLILDEPTNHLDIWACDSLEEALKEFDGTVIVVSHDRYFLNRVVDLLIVIEPGHSELVFGNYDTYELLRSAREDARLKEEAKKSVKREDGLRKSDSGTNSENVPNRPAKRKRKFPYRKVEELEKDISETEIQIANLEAKLVAPETYRDARLVQDTTRELESARTSLHQLMEHWEEAVELN
jgi:ATP-binding cassette, subfamily F, member 3